MKTLLMTAVSVLLATAATAAPIEESVGVDEGKCEVVSVGLYFCKIGGKCYSCTKSKDVDPKKDCFKEETCAAAMVQPDAVGLVTRPTRFLMSPTTSMTNQERPLTTSALCQYAD